MWKPPLERMIGAVGEHSTNLIVEQHKLRSTKQKRFVEYRQNLNRMSSSSAVVLYAIGHVGENVSCGPQNATGGRPAGGTVWRGCHPSSAKPSRSDRCRAIMFVKNNSSHPRMTSDRDGAERMASEPRYLALNPRESIFPLDRDRFRAWLAGANREFRRGQGPARLVPAVHDRSFPVP